MAAQAAPRLVTRQEYLQFERSAERRSEYHNGLLTSMAGASPEHNIITANVITQLSLQLQKRGCIAFASDLRLRVDACNAYFYPDVTVVCAEPVYEDLEGVRALQNATLIVEVLSDSTETRDRGEKWHCYQTLDSLTTYVLIAQDRTRVEVFTRLDGGDWRLSTFQDPNMPAMLPAVGGEIRVGDLYAGIVVTNSTPEPG